MRFKVSPKNSSLYEIDTFDNYRWISASFEAALRLSWILASFEAALRLTLSNFMWANSLLILMRSYPKVLAQLKNDYFVEENLIFRVLLSHTVCNPNPKMED